MTICDGCDGILGIGCGIENIVTIVTTVTDDDGKDGLMDWEMYRFLRNYSLHF